MRSTLASIENIKSRLDVRPETQNSTTFHVEEVTYSQGMPYEVKTHGSFHKIYQDPEPKINSTQMVMFSLGLCIAEDCFIGIAVTLCYLITEWGDWMKTWSGWLILVLAFPGFGITLSFFFFQMLENKLFIFNFVLKGIFVLFLAYLCLKK